MSKMRDIGFIGAGNMAGAIIAKILDRRILPPSKVGLYDIDAEKCRKYEEAGHPVYGSVEELAGVYSTIVLSIKPQTFPEVLPQLRRVMTPDKLLVSIAAGIGSEYIHKGVGFPCKLILVMPNTPLLVGVGATALSRVEPATDEEFQQIKRIFAIAGIAEEVPADKMNEIMSVHATTPAFMYLFAKTVVDSAEKVGIDRDVANRLFCQMLHGSAWMMTETGMDHQTLIDMVCSPGGTTLAGLAALEEKGFVPAVQEAFAACIKRAEELAL